MNPFNQAFSHSLTLLLTLLGHAAVWVPAAVVFLYLVGCAVLVCSALRSLINEYRRP